MTHAMGVACVGDVMQSRQQSGSQAAGMREHQRDVRCWCGPTIERHERGLTVHHWDVWLTVDDRERATSTALSGYTAS